MLLAPKGRENPAALAGKQQPAIHEESRVEEWAEDLVAVAKGSGIVAAATVAGQHETEDAVAVGDIDELDVDEADVFETESETDDQADAETDLVEHDLEATVVDQETETRAVDDEAEVAADADDTAVVVYEEAAAEPASVVVYESEDAESDLAAEAVEVVEADEVEPEPESQADVEAEPVVDPESADAAQQLDSDEPAKLKGSTLKRLLWGAGSRGD